MSEWFAMGGHGFYIWSSYLMLALAVVTELLMLRRRRAQAIEHARMAAEEEEHA
jgi:heme exporter protein D